MSGTTYIARFRESSTVVERTIYASSDAHALKQARRLGDLISVSPARRSFRSGGMTATERFQFLNRLATMLRSRVQPERALEVIADVFSGRIRSAAESALGPVRDGVQIADVLVADTKNFPGPVALLIKAGSEGGNTPDALREASRFELETGRALKSVMGQVLSSTAYILTALVMLAVSRFYIIPQMFESGLMEAASEAAGEDLVDVGPYIVMNDVALVFCVFMTISMIGLFLLATVGRSIVPDKADELIFRIPILRDIVLTADNYVAFIRLSFLVRAGVRLHESLQAVGEASRPGALKEDLKRAALAVLSGREHRWAEDMRSIHATDRAALSISVDARELAMTLEHLAESTRELYLQRLAILGPAIGMVSLSMITLASVVMIVLTTIPPMQVMTAMIAG